MEHPGSNPPTTFYFIYFFHTNVLCVAGSLLDMESDSERFCSLLLFSPLLLLWLEQQHGILLLLCLCPQSLGTALPLHSRSLPVCPAPQEIQPAFQATTKMALAQPASQSQVAPSPGQMAFLRVTGILGGCSCGEEDLPTGQAVAL